MRIIAMANIILALVFAASSAAASPITVRMVFKDFDGQTVGGGSYTYDPEVLTPASSLCDGYFSTCLAPDYEFPAVTSVSVSIYGIDLGFPTGNTPVGAPFPYGGYHYYYDNYAQEIYPEPGWRWRFDYGSYIFVLGSTIDGIVDAEWEFYPYLASLFYPDAPGLQPLLDDDVFTTYGTIQLLPTPLPAAVWLFLAGLAPFAGRFLMRNLKGCFAYSVVTDGNQATNNPLEDGPYANPPTPFGCGS